ncbi:hypothetical protein [Luteimonas arsenica]|uniref:hypothetical protein n=1 Tax=Luteimonas arsenica TaxID=1586242 RepID=UPI001054A12D|nr:hypothetical protein [Luteimonas arsenica]
MERIKHCVRWALAASLFFAGTASAQHGGECAAALSQGEHLGGALLYGIRSPENTAGFKYLTHVAPELALALFDQGITSEGARSSDMKRLESRTRRIITPEFVGLVAAGAAVGEGDVQRLTKEVDEGFEVLVESTTEVLDKGRATLVLGSKLVRTGTQETTAVMNQYLVHLEQVDSETVGVEGYPSLSANVYDIVGIERL